jgi:hypothetical protein
VFQKMKLTPEETADLIDSNAEVEAARDRATSIIAQQLPGIPLPLNIVISDGLGELESSLMRALIDTDWKEVGEIIALRHPEAMKTRDQAIAEVQARGVLARGQRREAAVN